MFKIGEFSKLSHTTVRTLRHYEEVGLLVPKEVNPDNHYRFYSGEQLVRLNKIRVLQQTGISLKIIKEVLDSGDYRSLEHHYQLREEEIQQELQVLETNKKIITLLQAELKAGNPMDTYNISLKEIPQRQVMSIRRKITDYSGEGVLWQELYQASLDQQVRLTHPPSGMTLYYDEEYKEINNDVEIQSTVKGQYEDTKHVKFYQAPAVTIASVTFKGSYEQMPKVTRALALWIEANHLKMTTTMITIPIVSPAQNPDPDSWVTEAGFIITK